MGITERESNACAASQSRPVTCSDGFTLIELLTVVSILAISLTLAAPSFTEVIAAQSCRRSAMDLYTTLVLARNEAIKRNQIVTISPKDGGWAAGWTVTDAGAVSVADYGPLNGIAIAGPDSIQFGRSGRVVGGAAPSLVVSTTRSESVDERCLGVDLSGRPHLEKKPSCS